jgi:Ni/Co efflux regulator RcnB
MKAGPPELRAKADNLHANSGSASHYSRRSPKGVAGHVSRLLRPGKPSRKFGWQASLRHRPYGRLSSVNPLCQIAGALGCKGACRRKGEGMMPMRFRLILTGAVLACGALAVGAAQGTVLPGTLVVADDDHHKDEHKGPPPGGGQPTVHTNTMMGPTHGTNTMGTQNHMNTQMHMNVQVQSGGGSTTQHNHMNTQMHGNAMTGAAGTNRNFDRHAYQRNFTAPHQYHIAHYRRPHGWYEHRWAYGEILPALFWAQDYWISDYYDYGLSDPPPGFVWVRYGDDALLVDENSGEVLQVEYNLFD